MVVAGCIVWIGLHMAFFMHSMEKLGRGGKFNLFEKKQQKEFLCVGLYIFICVWSFSFVSFTLPVSCYSVVLLLLFGCLVVCLFVCREDYI